jgi:EAL domain
MRHKDAEAFASVATFGRRKVRPRACVADGKDHIRTFLMEALEELGFVTCECRHAAQLGPLLDAQRPDVVVLGLSAGAIEAGEILKTLAAAAFDGKVLLLGPPACPAMAAIQELAETLEIAMLPRLDTPFGEGGLRNALATLLPIESTPDPAIHVDEAMKSGWLELWYQPEIDARSLAAKRAEALVRIRHPTWGVVPAAYFIPGDGDPTSARCRSSSSAGRSMTGVTSFRSTAASTSPSTCRSPSSRTRNR